MHLVEIETKLRKDGVIQIPDKELEATGMHEGVLSSVTMQRKKSKKW